MKYSNYLPAATISSRAFGRPCNNNNLRKRRRRCIIRAAQLHTRAEFIYCRAGERASSFHLRPAPRISPIMSRIGPAAAAYIYCVRVVVIRAPLWNSLLRPIN